MKRPEAVGKAICNNGIDKGLDGDNETVKDTNSNSSTLAELLLSGILSCAHHDPHWERTVSKRQCGNAELSHTHTTH